MLNAYSTRPNNGELPRSTIIIEWCGSGTYNIGGATCPGRNEAQTTRSPGAWSLHHGYGKTCSRLNGSHQRKRYDYTKAIDVGILLVVPRLGSKGFWYVTWKSTRLRSTSRMIRAVAMKNHRRIDREDDDTTIPIVSLFLKNHLSLTRHI